MPHHLLCKANFEPTQWSVTQPESGHNFEDILNCGDHLWILPEGIIITSHLLCQILHLDLGFHMDSSPFQIYMWRVSLGLLPNFLNYIICQSQTFFRFLQIRHFVQKVLPPFQISKQATRLIISSHYPLCVKVLFQFFTTAYPIFPFTLCRMLGGTGRAILGRILQMIIGSLSLT